MASKYRRVVTGHTPDGKSTVLFDSMLPLVEPRTGAGNDAEVDRHGAASSVGWTTQGFPSDNNGLSDDGKRKVRTAQEDGTVLRLVQYSPGVMPRHHRTKSIDYAIVVSGSIEMQLDTETVNLNTGDILVQRGTLHNWINSGSEPCLIAYILIGAHPVIVNGETLEPKG